MSKYAVGSAAAPAGWQHREATSATGEATAMSKIVLPGHYYDMSKRVTEASPGEPEYVVCRRLRDYAGTMPLTGAITWCARCHCAVVFDPMGPHPDRPRVCMQCVGIEPLPL